MVEGSVARRYAKALFELAHEAGAMDTVLADVERFEAMCAAEGGIVGKALTNPLVTKDERARVLAHFLPDLKLTALSGNFLRLLSDKGRMNTLGDIIREYRALTDAEANRVRATVTTASPLDAATRDEVRSALEARTGKTVVVATQVDPSLLGGMVARVGSVVYDASLRSRLDRLQLSLSAPIRA